MPVKHSIIKISFLFAFIFFTAGSLMAQLPKVACGSIKRLANFPSKFVDARNVDIWLPEDYSADKKYPVLYMHDGMALFDSTLMWNKEEWGVDETLCRLIGEKRIKECIVVGIWNNGAKRHAEYVPEKAFNSMSQADQQRMLAVGKDKGTPLFANGPLSDDYLKFLVTELKPYIDTHFSTLRDQGNTFIAGSSMGGLISMYAICEYPNVFGGAACLSTHWPGLFTTVDNPIPAALLRYLKSHLPSPKNHKIYFDYGSETLDAMYKPYQVQADSIMKAAGYSDKNWMTREYPGADHSENSWRKRFNVPVLFLLGK